MTKLRLMSNNLWWNTFNTPAWEAMGADCSNAARVPGFARMYRETQPDIIGLQECSARMTRALMIHLADNDFPYTMVWGGDTSILFHQEKFELVDSKAYIYPEEIPGLEGSFNNLQTKSYCVGVFRVKATGQLLIFASTHLWYRSEAACPGSEAARAWQMEQLIGVIDGFREQYPCPAVLVGDFNTWPIGAAVQTAIKSGFVHAHYVAEEADNTTGMHYCCDKGFATKLNEGDFSQSLDHILLRNFDGKVASFARYCPDYYFKLSDHSATWIDVEF